MINKVILYSKLRTWWHIHVVFSKSLVCIWVLVATNSFVENGVTSVIADYLAQVLTNDVRKAAVMSNGIDALLSFLVILPHHSQSFVGRFNVLTFYAGAYVAGLLQLWVGYDCPYRLSPEFFMSFSLGFLLLTLGKSGLSTTLLDFLQHQLKQKVSLLESENIMKETSIIEQERINEVRFGLWFYSAQLSGAAFTAFLDPDILWSQLFMISAFSMGIGYLVFYSGCILYNMNDNVYDNDAKAKENEIIALLRKSCRVYKAAFKKRKLDYPASFDSYHGKYNQRHKLFYHNDDDKIQFLPKAFGGLDKAAIISTNDDDRADEKCGVNEVMEVKGFSSVIVLFFILLPYGLMLPTATTFFVLRGDTMRKDYNISALFVMRLAMYCLVSWFFWWKKLEHKKITKVRILGGMVCSVIFFLTAWRVEIHVISSSHVNDVSISWLIPQFLLFGLAEALVGNGFAVFFFDHVPPLMWEFWEPLIEFMFGIGKLMTIVFTLVFSKLRWLKESLDNNSKLDRYYLMLAILNLVFIFIYGYYCKSQAFNEAYPRDEPENEENIQGNAQEGLGIVTKSEIQSEG